jgi:hypothetical protein
MSNSRHPASFPETILAINLWNAQTDCSEMHGPRD